MSPKQRFMQQRELDAIAAYQAIMQQAEEDWRLLRIEKKHAKKALEIDARAKSPSMGQGKVKYAKTVAPQQPSFSFRSLFSSLITALIY